MSYGTIPKSASRRSDGTSSAYSSLARWRIAAVHALQLQAVKLEKSKWCWHTVKLEKSKGCWYTAKLLREGNASYTAHDSHSLMR